MRPPRRSIYCPCSTTMRETGNWCSIRWSSASGEAKGWSRGDPECPQMHACDRMSLTRRSQSSQRRREKTTSAWAIPEFLQDSGRHFGGGFITHSVSRLFVRIMLDLSFHKHSRAGIDGRRISTDVLCWYRRGNIGCGVGRFAVNGCYWAGFPG